MRSRASFLRSLLDDSFNRSVLGWLSIEPHSFADIVETFQLPRMLIRERLQALIRAGLLDASNAHPIDYARRIWTVPGALRAAGIEPVSAVRRRRKKTKTSVVVVPGTKTPKRPAGRPSVR